MTRRRVTGARADREVDRALRELASGAGVQTAYTDGMGTRRRASPEAIVAVLRMLGIGIERPADAPAVLRESMRETEPLAPPVLAAWGDRRRSITLTSPRPCASRPAELEIELETGESVRARVDGRPLPARDERGTVRVRFELPELPIGVHRVRIRHAGRTVESTLLAAPRRCWGGAERSLGLFLPTYAARSDTDWGAGGVAELCSLLEMTSNVGATWLGTLPLLAQYYDNPFEPGPYSPVSRRFWNELLVDIERAPELEASPEARRRLGSKDFQSRLASLRSEAHVDYAGVWRAKWEVLRELARTAFLNKDSAAVRAVETDPELGRYARFRAATLRSGVWSGWSRAARAGGLTRNHYDQADYETFAYAQQLVRGQLGALAAHGRESGARLYLDLPLGAHPDGYDTWSAPDQFVQGASMGAPPDALFAGGQDWSIPPLHPVRAREAGHAHFIGCIREHLRYAGALRIDHVMWLHRVFWVPKGASATDGVYIASPTEDLYAILAIESHRARARIVGEDLGTVPRAVRTAMKRRGVLGMSVALFELDGPRDLPSPPPATVASLDTHDTPTLPGFLSGQDAELRRGLGLMSDDFVEAERRRRERIRKRLVAALRRASLIRDDSPRSVVEGLLRVLASGDAEVVIVNLEDLLLETHPQNIPGVTEGYPNWRRRLPISVAALAGETSDLLRELSRLRGSAPAIR